MALSDELTIKVKLRFLITIATGIGAMVIFLVTLRIDVINLLKQVSAQQVMLETNQKSIIGMQMNLQSVTDELKYFRQQYERDMKTYIRE